MTSAPAQEQQLAFLTNVQRLLDEGQFTATYKFALLLALVEIAIERGAEGDDALTIEIDGIAAKFIELYWSHTRPFRGAVLSQNRGSNIAVLSLVSSLQRDSMSFAQARRSPRWREAVRSVSRIIREMPLRRLQLLRGGKRVPFIYDDTSIVDGAIVLKPGAMYCLRKFSVLVGTLARDAWMREVRANPRNVYSLGEAQSLEAFLFGDDRVALTSVVEVLQPLQESRCFYCDAPLRDIHVDHFVPWSLYRNNLGHNLVLAHKVCNEDKLNLLPDIPFLSRWHDRNQNHGDVLATSLTAKGIVCDLEASVGIARWAYERALSSRATVWAGRKQTRELEIGTKLPL